MSDPDFELNPCAICKRATFKRCGQCRQQFYCSKAHQREHWSTHKSSCVFAPRSAVVLGVRLPASTTTPELVRVTCSLERGEICAQETPVYIPDLAEHIGKDKYDSRLLLPEGPIAPGTIGLRLFYRASSHFDGPPVNETVQKICAGRPAQQWRGDMLVMKVVLSAGGIRETFVHAHHPDVLMVGQWLKYSARDAPFLVPLAPRVKTRMPNAPPRPSSP